MMTSVYREVHCWELKREARFFGALWFHFISIRTLKLCNVGKLAHLDVLVWIRIYRFSCLSFVCWLLWLFIRDIDIKNKFFKKIWLYPNITFWCVKFLFIYLFFNSTFILVTCYCRFRYFQNLKWSIINVEGDVNL